MIVEIKSPFNDWDYCQVLLTYEPVLVNKGRSHMSNGDVGYPDEYVERLVKWEYIDPFPQPEWLTDMVVRVQVDTVI